MAREMSESDWAKLKADLHMRAEATYNRARDLHDMRVEFETATKAIEANGNEVEVETPTPAQLAQRAADSV